MLKFMEYLRFIAVMLFVACIVFQKWPTWQAIGFAVVLSAVCPFVEVNPLERARKVYANRNRGRVQKRPF